MSTIKKFNFRTLLLSATLGIALGTTLGILIAPQFFSGPVPPANCDAPASVTLLQKNANSVKIAWDSVPGVENYLVTVRDSATLSITKAIYAVKGKEFTVPDLQANHGYRVDVQSLCVRAGAGSFVSSVAKSLGVRTKEIIIVIEVIEFGGTKQPCDKTNCNSSVSISSNCFNWSAGTEYYQIDITQNGTTTSAMKMFFEKTSTNGFMQISSVKELRCGAKFYAQNPPKNLNCNNTMTVAHLCGTLPYTPQGGTPTAIPYRLEFTNSHCCVVFDDPAQAANYTVTVTKCTDVSTQ